MASPYFDGITSPDILIGSVFMSSDKYFTLITKDHFEKNLHGIKLGLTEYLPLNDAVKYSSARKDDPSSALKLQIIFDLYKKLDIIPEEYHFTAALSARYFDRIAKETQALIKETYRKYYPKKTDK